MGLALVWAFGPDRWGDPVYTHGSLTPFRGEAVRGPFGGVLVCLFLFLLPLLCSVCVCISKMPHGTYGKDASGHPRLYSIRKDALAGYLVNLFNFPGFILRAWRACNVMCCFRSLLLCRL